ncbi:MAG: cell division protein SepF [Coriobacteriales bacterium]|jgi:cell division inhibitor SepF|nr:cell division protein SepF [Coriobacteriales bacterium]
MGIWDSVKNRLGMGGGRTDDYRDYDDYGYDGYASASYEGEEAELQEYDDRPAPMRSYGVDRADYYNDNHAPLVTQADVRSQLIPTAAVGQVRDRIPAPRAYPRATSDSGRQEHSEDAFAFKNGLARTPGSFAQLQSERLRMEDTGRLVALSTGTGPSATGAVGTTGGAGVAGTAGAASALDVDVARNTQMPRGEIVNGTDLFGQQRNQISRVTQGQVRRRVHRRIEHIRPMTYADAEQVAQELKKGILVVLDLRSTRPELAKRILDFSFGVASALEGQVDRHIDRVYIFTRNGPLTDEERAAVRI